MLSPCDPPRHLHHNPDSSSLPQSSRICSDTAQLVAQPTVTNLIQDSTEHAESTGFQFPLNLQTYCWNNCWDSETRSKILQAASEERVRYLAVISQPLPNTNISIALQQSKQGWWTRGNMLKYYATIMCQLVQTQEWVYLHKPSVGFALVDWAASFTTDRSFCTSAEVFRTAICIHKSLRYVCTS